MKLQWWKEFVTKGTIAILQEGAQQVPMLTSITAKVTHSKCCLFCTSIHMYCSPGKTSTFLWTEGVWRSWENKSAFVYCWILSPRLHCDKSKEAEKIASLTLMRRRKSEVGSSIQSWDNSKKSDSPWTAKKILYPSLEGRDWNTDHFPHWKQSLPQSIEYIRISHASFLYSGQAWNSLLWSLIQCESHTLKTEVKYLGI